jgi:hypothetical protein
MGGLANSDFLWKESVRSHEMIMKKVVKEGGNEDIY